jgi:hypothetical protein
MAKKSKKKGSAKSSRRRSKRGGKRSGRRAAKSSVLGKAFKDGAIIAAGALSGALAESTGYLPAGVSGPAVGMLAAGFVATGGKRMPSGVVISAAIATQVLATGVGLDKFKELEAKVVKAFEPKVLLTEYGAPKLAKG